MLKITPNVKAGFSFLAIFSLVVFFYSCDTMEEDAIPNGPTVTIEGSEVYVMPDGTTYIDLYSKVKTNGKVSLDIAALPRKGKLTEIASGFLKYSPNAGFNSGRDAFSFSVLGAQNQLLKLDSIEIIVEDSLNLPCGIYPNDDWIYAAGTPIEANVLSNDHICGDSTDVVLEIYKPGNNFPPYNGTAEVTPWNTVRYVSTLQQDVVDTVVYKVYYRNDPGIVAFGTLYINANYHCSPDLGHMETVYTPPSNATYPLMDSVYLYLVDNAERCGKVYSELTITKYPNHNPIGIVPRGVMYYFELQDSSEHILDSLGYKLCNGPDCLNGDVRIKIN
jgi:hypothetical protein